MFHPELISFLSLLKRSPDVGDGWRRYSETLRTLVVVNHNKFPGMFEVDSENMLVRTSPAEGRIVEKWMNFAPPKTAVVEKEDEGDDGEE